MERIIASGHEIGNHMCKDRASIKLSAEEYSAKTFLSTKFSLKDVRRKKVSWKSIPPNSRVTVPHDQRKKNRSCIFRENLYSQFHLGRYANRCTRANLAGTNLALTITEKDFHAS